MRLEGRIWKSGTSKYWLAEASDLDIVTQGRSRKDAAVMLEDAIALLVVHPRFRVEIAVRADGRCTIDSNDDARLIALLLRRLRVREGLSVREVAKRLKSRSPNSYAQYERGRIAPSISTLTKLLAALNPRFQPVLRVA